VLLRAYFFDTATDLTAVNGVRPIGSSTRTFRR